jgi:hypothetical protein
MGGCCFVRLRLPGQPWKGPRPAWQEDSEQAPRKRAYIQACVVPGRAVRVPHFPCREGSDPYLPQLNENDAAPSSAIRIASSRTASHLTFYFLFQARGEERRRVLVIRQ